MCTVAEVLHSYLERHDTKKLADSFGTTKSNLYRMFNPNDEYRGLWVTQIIPLVQCTNDFSILDHIEAQVGRVAVFVGLEKIEALNTVSACRFMKESGEAMKAIAGSIEDGRVTKQEARECLKELMDLVQVSMGLMEKFREVIDG